MFGTLISYVFLEWENSIDTSLQWNLACKRTLANGSPLDIRRSAHRHQDKDQCIYFERMLDSMDSQYSEYIRGDNLRKDFQNNQADIDTNRRRFVHDTQRLRHMDLECMDLFDLVVESLWLNIDWMGRRYSL